MTLERHSMDVEMTSKTSLKRWDLIVKGVRVKVWSPWLFKLRETSYYNIWATFTGKHKTFIERLRPIRMHYFIWIAISSLTQTIKVCTYCDAMRCLMKENIIPKITVLPHTQDVLFTTRRNGTPQNTAQTTGALVPPIRQMAKLRDCCRFCIREKVEILKRGYKMNSF